MVDLTQRELAKAMEISLGKANCCLRNLIDVGVVRANNARNSTNKSACLYTLTPRGIEEKAIVTHRFLLHKQAEYEAIRREIEDLRAHAMECEARVAGETNCTMAHGPTIISHKAIVTRGHSERLNGHRAGTLWFTGLSGSGKSTLAHLVEERLHAMGCQPVVLDGDNVRLGLCKDLGFTCQDRSENIRRVAETANLFLNTGVIILAAFISPTQHDRELARQIIGPENFYEIYCHCPLEICEYRDVKGLYNKARAGLIKNYTGVSAPYDVPENSDLRLETGTLSLEDCILAILHLLSEKGLLSPP